MKHHLTTRNSEQLSLVFAGANRMAPLVPAFNEFGAGFKNVYDQQMSKPAYPMAFFYVKVHNPLPAHVEGDGDSHQEVDEEFVYVHGE